MLYGADLAYIHDAGFSDWARGAAPFLLDLFGRRLPPSSLVVDLGCGSGVWAEAAAEAGYAILGVDLSPDMIRLARQRVPAAKFVVASLLEVDLPPCQAVTAMGEPLNYLRPRGQGSTDLRRLFRRVFHALVPGGLFIFDLAQPGQVSRQGRRGYSLGDDWAVLFDTHEDPQRHTLTRRIVTFRRSGQAWRRHDEVHEQRLYRGPEILAELRRIGFRARLLRGYGATRLPGNRVVVVASKPAR